MTLDLVGITEIAQRAGTAPGTVQSWRNRHTDFPEPLVRLAIGPVWDWEPVRVWLALPRQTGAAAQGLMAVEGDIRWPRSSAT